jgi:hypothetical protein
MHELRATDPDAGCLTTDHALGQVFGQTADADLLATGAEQLLTRDFAETADTALPA